MSDETRYLYEIRPIKPIRDLIPGKIIKRACSMQLTKDEVLYCMKFGSVWRRFSGKDPLKVTGKNLPIMHQSIYNESIITDNNTEEKTKTIIEDIAEESKPVEVVEEPATNDDQFYNTEESPKESEEELQNSTTEEELASSEDEEKIDSVVEANEETSLECEVEEIANEIIEDLENKEDVVEEESKPVEVVEEPATNDNDVNHTNTIKINTSNNYHKNNKHKK